MVGLLMTMGKGEGLAELGGYINWSNAFKIISGIFLSILFAFSLGSIVQYISRLILSFNYERNLKKYGGLFAGIAITSITYFLIVKGLKGSPWKGSAFYEYITGNTWTVVLVLFVFWTIVSQLLMMLAKVNPLKVVVLAGTFALAMAFAGNDLVNFIGVPIAAYSAYGHWMGEGVAADQLYMEFFKRKGHCSINFLTSFRNHYGISPLVFCQSQKGNRNRSEFGKTG